MANICVKSIAQVTTGKHQKYFILEFEDGHKSAYAASIDNEMYSKNNGTDNMHSLFSDNGLILHDLYDLKDVCILSNVKDFQGKQVGIYAPDLEEDVLDIVLNGDYTYAISRMTDCTSTFDVTDLVDKRKCDPNDIHSNKHAKALEDVACQDYLYAVSADETGKVTTDFSVGNTLHGLKRNYVLEMLSDKKNNYAEGDLLGDVIVCKNAYDAKYSVNMDNATSVEDCRQYVGLGICGDTMFMKFRDDIDYVGHKDGNNVTLSQKPQLSFSFLKVETLGNSSNGSGISRFEDNLSHKTNMFSLKIHNVGLANLDISDQLIALKAKIKMDIENNVRDIVKKTCPVHTQLMKVECVD